MGIRGLFYGELPLPLNLTLHHIYAITYLVSFLDKDAILSFRRLMSTIDDVPHR